MSQLSFEEDLTLNDVQPNQEQPSSITDKYSSIRPDNDINDMESRSAAQTPEIIQIRQSQYKIQQQQQRESLMREL